MRKLMLGIAIAGLLAAGCSNSTPTAGASETDSPGLRGLEPCVGFPSPIASPGFPSAFPDIGDVTWVASQKNASTQVVNGYTGDALTSLFDEMNELFSKGGYSVTKSEHDPHDAEVNFAGNKTTGQVRLGEECQGRTSVTVTIRPA